MRLVSGLSHRLNAKQHVSFTYQCLYSSKPTVDNAGA